ncbi:cysteinyl leukotriene receptor 1 isoform X2 [Lutzomyia longipalpis]|uniref:cysteinyl leukotriene receptor 1 isoform X2 n=1 Tax=Lutzomyia longipalpis TaxID=7200 RepID=UPI002483B4B3|nr:cysteinyl leukotriene receptor 1 isoform X2 [Lutzomyia longipalpis]
MDIGTDNGTLHGQLLNLYTTTISPDGYISTTTQLSPTNESYVNSSAAIGASSTLLNIAEEVGDFLITYYTPVLVFTGSIGNMLSVLVFCKTKLRKLSSSYYLAALGVSDTCFLVGLFISWLNFVDVNLTNRNIFCQSFTYLSGLCSFLSVWFVVAFTVERFIAVLYPLKRQTMCTVKRAKIVLCGLTVLGGVHSAPFIMFASPQFSERLNTTICDVREEYKGHMTIFNYIDTIIVFVVPFTAIVILNSITGFTVWKVAGVRRSMTIQKRQGSSALHEFRKAHPNHQLCTHPNGHNNVNLSLHQQRSTKQRVANSSQIKVTKMLLMVSTVFVILNLPSYVMRVRAYIETSPSKTTIVIQYYCWLFFITNFGINFALYCVSGQNFRKALVGMFRRVSHHRQDGNTQVTVSEYVRSTGSTISRRRIIARNGSFSDAHELHLLTTNIK